MKERSITNRNFCGGFLGGTLGILAFALVYPYLLPIGCLIGVVIGFWYQEIIQAIVDSWKETILLWKWRIYKAKVFLKLLFSVRFVLSKAKKYTVDPVARFFTHNINISFMASFFNLKKSTFLRWIIGHPMNRACFLKIIAASIFWSINLLLGVVIFYVSLNSVDTAKPENPLPLFFFLGLCLWGFSVVVLPIVMFSRGEGTKTKMRNFYREFRRYSEKGAFRFLIRNLLMLFYAELGIVVMGVIAFCYLFAGAALLLTLIFLPVMTFVLLSRKLYSIATRENHWMCFIATLAVTTLSAWLTHPYLSNSIILWIIALGTGCASGITTELARRSIAELLKKSEFMFNLWTFSFEKFLLRQGKLLMAPIDKTESFWSQAVLWPLQ